MIKIGDNNRVYTVKIACFDVEPEKQEKALEFLKMKLTRRKRINLRPKGFDDGVLLAQVIPMDSNEDISNTLVKEGFGRLTCAPARN